MFVLNTTPRTRPWPGWRALGDHAQWQLPITHKQAQSSDTQTLATNVLAAVCAPGQAAQVLPSLITLVKCAPPCSPLRARCSRAIHHFQRTSTNHQNKKPARMAFWEQKTQAVAKPTAEVHGLLSPMPRRSLQQRFITHSAQHHVSFISAVSLRSAQAKAREGSSSSKLALHTLRSAAQDGQDARNTRIRFAFGPLRLCHGR